MEKLLKERKEFESLGLSYPPHNQVKIEKVIVAGIENYWFIPDRTLSQEVVIYLHGGGFLYGSVKSHQAMVSHLAAATGRRFFFVEYSLAPEKPFPNALNESTAIILELMHTMPRLQFALMGDSAGGNLAMSIALNLKKLKRPLPMYQILLSPWINIKTEYPSYAENEKLDPVITKPFVQYAASLYTEEQNFSNPLVSPILGTFTGFGPTLMMVGAKEILRDDSVVLHEALKKANVRTELKIFEEATHVWILTDIQSADSQETLKIIRGFMNSMSNALK